MKKQFEIKFTNAQGHELAKTFAGRDWMDALDAFRVWARANPRQAYKFVGVYGVHYGPDFVLQSF